MTQKAHKTYLKITANPSNAFINILVLLIAVGPLWKPANS